MTAFPKNYVDPRTLNPINLEIVAARMEAFNKRQGPRVGDFLRLPATDPRQGDMTRFTQRWPDKIQTGGMGGSFYLGSNYLDYSGSLDSGIIPADIIPTDETRDGSLWIFDLGQSGAHRGVDFMRPMRVFKTREGANLDGLDELRCPYNLNFWPPDCRNVVRYGNHPYAWTITKHCMSERAFREEEEPALRAWLAKMDLHAWEPLIETQSLKYQPKSAT